MLRPSALALLATAVAATVTATATPAAAHPSSELTAVLNAERSAALCPPLQAEAAVEQVAHMASQNNLKYAAFQTAAVPFTDPMPALTTIGHPASKALLLSGYGSSSTDALHFVTLSYRALKPDCSYTQYGGSVLQNDAGHYFVSVVLTAA